LALRNTPEAYGSVAKALHWSIALLIFGNLGLYMGNLEPSPATIKTYNLHKSIGLTILLLVLLRIAWRLGHPAPGLPAELPSWERRAARASHLLLYAMILIQPISGLVMALASEFPTTIFGWFNLPSPIGHTPWLKDAMLTLHSWSVWLLLLLVVVHVAAALRHHFLLRNDILRRMLPFGGLLLFAMRPAWAEVPAWQLEPESSRLTFTAFQSGEPVEGLFRSFTAEIRFSRENPAAGSAEVEIDMASVDTGSSDRDQTIRSEVLFHVAEYPKARFVASRFEALGENRYRAPGQLTLRGVTRDLELPFTLEIEQREDRLLARAEGKLEIDRLDYGVGQGQWQDTSVVADRVIIGIDIRASRPAGE
jgi:cytochrome b561